MIAHSHKATHMNAIVAHHSYCCSAFQRVFTRVSIWKNTFVLAKKKRKAWNMQVTNSERSYKSYVDWNLLVIAVWYGWSRKRSPGPDRAWKLSCCGFSHACWHPGGIEADAARRRIPPPVSSNTTWCGWRWGRRGRWQRRRWRRLKLREKIRSLQRRAVMLGNLLAGEMLFGRWRRTDE